MIFLICILNVTLFEYFRLRLYSLCIQYVYITCCVWLVCVSVFSQSSDNQALLQVLFICYFLNIYLYVYIYICMHFIKIIVVIFFILSALAFVGRDQFQLLNLWITHIKIIFSFIRLVNERLHVIKYVCVYLYMYLLCILET